MLRAGRHQYCRYYPRNNYHTLSLAESEYRGIEAAAFDSEGKYFLIITNIFMTKEWMNEVQVDCQMSIFHVSNVSMLCYQRCD